MSNKVPQIRFNGYSDAWEERKLGEISRMYQPLTITGNDLLPDGVPVFGANGFIGFFSEANHIDDQVTISARGEGAGTPSYVHGPVWITGNSMVVNVGDFDIDKYFLFANLTANSLKKYVTGGAQPQLTRDVLVKVPITLPNTDEQKKIGAFFKQLDDTITLHQRKLDLLKEQKKGYLQKMFPKNGEKVPELRFAGFADDWEERKLTDVTSSYSGLTYSPTDVQDKGTFVLRSSNVKNDQLVDADNVYVNPDIVNSNNVKVGDVIVVVRNGSRSLIGKHAIIIKEMPNTVIGAFMSAFRGQNGDYINALLSTNNFQKEVHKSLGATINQITGKDFSMMNFLTPKLEEQSKIGSFFKQLDDTIALHQRKLDLLKEQKKGFLQNMFV
ncbi:restriction endonuclease subunit S [Lactiplantibacillus plantarum]|uniref:restriction endonuclease subunit S n=1 Tax=Lactiplantibacillus plantarum TaxID=1590 RepID=UPI0005ED8539|nr:restriction endonuclease subunit S [Lactiplantibacillus plantarum]KZU96537.1 Type I restriction-modification system specificity subunit S [Lactiplantibacillus plantarum]